MTLRVLLLAQSGDDPAAGFPNGSANVRIERALSAWTGEPATVDMRYAFPTPGLPRYAARLVDQLDPEVVIVGCWGSAAIQTLTPLLERLLGRQTIPVGRPGRRLVRWLFDADPLHPLVRPRGPRQQIYAAGYNALLRAGLGAPMADMDAVITAHLETIAMLAAREDLVVLVRGPHWITRNRALPRLYREHVRGLRAFEAAAAALCERRRIPYVSLMQLYGPMEGRWLGPDQIHPSDTANRAWAAAAVAALQPLLPAAPGRTAARPTVAAM
jgi:hypothetical protein